MGDRPQWSLEAVIALAIEKRLLRVHTHLICRVTRYDATKQRVDCVPEVQESFYAEDGTRTGITIPTLVDVPVAFPRFGPYRLVGPVMPGDRVLVEIHESSIASWKPRGGTTDPQDDRRFHLSDAIALVGVADAAHALQDSPTTHMSIGADDGAASISIDQPNSEVRLGDDTASELVAWNSDLKTLLNAITNAVPVSGDGGAALQASILSLLGASWPVGASKVKAK